MTDPDRLKVLVSHADEVVEAGLIALVRRAPDMAHVELEATDVSDADLLRLCGLAEVDVLIADYDRSLRFAALVAHTPRFLGLRHPRLLVFTSKDSHVEIRAAVEAGIQGYLLHGCRAADIGDAIRMVGHGLRHLCSVVALRLVEEMYNERLTVRETQVLLQVAAGCPNKVIAGRLGVELATVKVHVAAILEKLGARNRTEAVAIANRRGLFGSAATLRVA